MLQEKMIARVRELCRSDERIAGAWMYGSFTRGEGDVYSDIEFLIYLEDAAQAVFDPIPWLEQVAPVGLYFINEFGVGTAIFENLIRGEFHFDRASDMAKIRELRHASGFPAVESMLISDRTGELSTHRAAISGAGPGCFLAATCWREASACGLWNCWDLHSATCCCWHGWQKTRSGTGGRPRKVPSASFPPGHSGASRPARHRFAAANWKGLTRQPGHGEKNWPTNLQAGSPLISILI
jgi:hypothetical protein